MSTTEIYSFDDFAFDPSAVTMTRPILQPSIPRTTLTPPFTSFDIPPPSLSPRRQSKHVKGLSLSFPILLPTSDRITREPSPMSSSTNTPLESGRTTPRLKASTQSISPARPPPPTLATASSSAEFLTLLAVQERKVLELKEELQKAETDLLQLKTQWAVFEANKKSNEAKDAKRSQPTSAVERPSAKENTLADEREEEKKRRILIEKSHNINADGTAMVKSPGRVARKGTKRVFEGRHARTLSLLSPQMLSSIQCSQALGSDNGTPSKELSDPLKSTDDSPRPSLSRMSTLDGILSPEMLSLSFGKTYKDLAAAHRRSLPPVAADMLMRQGKQVVDGVREGFWTFFEDIKQVAIGEENDSGKATSKSTRPPGQTGRLRQHTGGSKKSAGLKDGHGKRNRRPSDKHALKRDDSFWTEFGLQTPQKPVAPAAGAIPAATVSKPHKTTSSHKQRNHTSSTDSSNPPDLLTDTGADENDDEEWDAWESPVIPTLERDSITSATEGNANLLQPTTGRLGWPDIPVLTPTKLDRGAPELIHEWENSATTKTGIM